MFTKNKRVSVTLPSEIWDLVSDFRVKFGCSSMSSAVVALVARGLISCKPLMRPNNDWCSDCPVSECGCPLEPEKRPCPRADKAPCKSLQKLDRVP